MRQGANAETQEYVHHVLVCMHATRCAVTPAMHYLRRRLRRRRKSLCSLFSTVANHNEKEKKQKKKRVRVTRKWGETQVNGTPSLPIFLPTPGFVSQFPRAKASIPSTMPHGYCRTRSASPPMTTFS